MTAPVFGTCCDHPEWDHGQERAFYETDSKREVCLLCPGYEEPGYPHGKAWHRFAGVLAAPSMPGDAP